MSDVAFSPEGWTELIAALSGGALEKLLLGTFSLDGPLTVSVNHLGAVTHGDAGTTVRITLGAPFYADVSCELITTFTSLCANAACDTGYISHDKGADPSPYERAIGISERMVLPQARTKLRGYYWGNVLSAEHLRILGGFDSVRQDAPCALVDDLSAGRGERAYLQLTSNFDEVSKQQLRDLRDYLLPLLPVGRRPFAYVGDPLHVLEAEENQPSYDDGSRHAPTGGPRHRDGAPAIDRFDLLWEGLPFSLTLDQELSPEVRQKVEVVIESWYRLGSLGVFGGWLHFISPITWRLTPSGGSLASWWVDMGNAERDALDAIETALTATVEDEDVGPGRLVIGVENSAGSGVS
jgi:hypothetical protein